MGVKSFARRLLLCLLTGIVGAYANFELCRLVFAKHLDIVNSVSLTIFLGSALYTFVWQYRAYKGKANDDDVMHFWQSALSYFIAIDLCMFACRKLFHLQFYAPDGLLDKPTSALTGEQMVIVFFAHSYVFGICIAASQILGSLLLLFQRTRLIGALILLPVLANIILIDIFYDVEAGALVMCCALMAGVIYFIGSQYERLMSFFFSKESSAARKHSLWSYAWRLSVILIPLSFCIILYDRPHRHPAITGKYKVESLIINRHPKDLSNCADTVLTLVYIDDKNDIVFERNGLGRWLVGHFTYDKNTNELNAIWRYPKGFHDTLHATIKDRGDKCFLLSGVMGRDTLAAQMLKVK